MSRKFTDSEVRAYSKNRHEEKILRKRLNKLKDEFGTFHDATAKQKQHLVAESKEIRMTTGGSPVPPGFVFDTEFDISKRMSRPWAYSVMETTYNAAYRDAVIPLPKSKPRPKSEASRSHSKMSTLLPNRAMSSKSRMSSLKSQSFVGSNSDANQLQPEFGSSFGTNGLQGFRRAHTDIQVKIDRTHAYDRGCTETDKIIHDAMTTNDNKHDKNSINADSNTFLTDRGSETKHDTKHNSDSHQGKEIHHNNDKLTVEEHVHSLDIHTPNEPRTNSYKPLPEVKHATKVITLPPMYKIDSKAYQEAERERLITRSKSRVSFSGIAPGVTEHQPERPSRRSPPNVEAKHQTIETKTNEHDLTKTENVESNQETLVNLSLDEQDLQRSSIFTLDPETMQDIRVKQVGDVVYKGRKLKNYIKPEDRYKLDPLVMKMRQNKMDKLAKESLSLLKRVNHENIHVDIAFPRTERKRILTKLVRANNSTNGKKHHDNHGPFIQRKVATFMDSITEYIHQQQVEREQFYA